MTKKLLLSSGRTIKSPTLSSDEKGVKLPKLDVPTFDGNILNWRSFWEQFCVSVHDRSNLSDPEKLVYLQHSLKNGSAKNIIEGLSHSGEHYAEAVDCPSTSHTSDTCLYDTRSSSVERQQW